MTLLGSITIPKTGWIWISAGLFVIVFALLVWTYRRAQALNPGNKTAFVLKLAGILTLILVLLEPIWSSRRAKSGANLFVIMADNSSGMNVTDRGITPNGSGHWPMISSSGNISSMPAFDEQRIFRS